MPRRVPIIVHKKVKNFSHAIDNSLSASKRVIKTLVCDDSVLSANKRKKTEKKWTADTANSTVAPRNIPWDNRVKGQTVNKRQKGKNKGRERENEVSKR